MQGPSKESIQKEIDILKQCKHDNIVQYYGSTVKGKVLWVLPIDMRYTFLLMGAHYKALIIFLFVFQILMEFCGGGAVNDILEKLGVLLLSMSPTII